MSDFPVPELAERARRYAKRLREAERVLHVSHIDADGLTSGAVGTRALERAGVEVETAFEKQLDEESIAEIADSGYETVLFTDFGSGQLNHIVGHEFTPVVADHHQPAAAEPVFHLNPLLEGVDGGNELSGAGATYVLARALLGDEARDLAALAVVGAVGDRQQRDGELVGANAEIVREGVNAGVLDTAPDLTLYGAQTRPLPKLLAFAGDVHIPGVTGNQRGAMDFLGELDADLKTEDGWKRWVDLDEADRRTVASGLLKRALASGVAADEAESLVGTTYTLATEKAGTELRDASEFSTLLNATARYERADVGLAVCLGDREGAFDAAQELLAEHRRNLSEGIEWVEREGTTKEKHLQWFDAGDEIRETIVGIVAGMAMGADGIDRNTPIVAFADADEGEVKVSARGTNRLVNRGLDLSEAMGEAARAVGGDGGGHTVAAGATIPESEREGFIERADEIIGEQLS